jgi:hypothetical protein
MKVIFPVIFLLFLFGKLELRICNVLGEVCAEFRMFRGKSFGKQQPGKPAWRWGNKIVLDLKKICLNNAE